MFAAKEHIQYTLLVDFLSLNYFQVLAKMYGTNDKEVEKFERVTEASRPPLLMAASIHARRQSCSASTWCAQPNAWAQQATAHTASTGKTTHLLSRGVQ